MSPMLIAGLLSASLILAHVLARRSQQMPTGSPARLILAAIFSTAATWLLPVDPVSAVLNAAGALWCWTAALSRAALTPAGESPPARETQPAPQPRLPSRTTTVHMPMPMPAAQPKVVARPHSSPLPQNPPAAPEPLANDRMMSQIVQEAQGDLQRLRNASSAGPANDPADQIPAAHDPEPTGPEVKPAARARRSRSKDSGKST